MVCKAFHDIVEINKHRLMNLKKDFKKSPPNKSETKTYIHKSKRENSSFCQLR